MTKVTRQTVFGTEVVSQAEQLDMNFQVGVFVDFESDSIEIQATCVVGDDLIHAFSCEDVGQLAIWIGDTIVEELERNQRAIDDANTVQ